MSSRIWIRRAYDPPSIMDGSRVLVDRLWPRGISKTKLRIDTWTRDLAPTDELRHWFGHDPTRWDQFRTRYREELVAQSGSAAIEFIGLIGRLASGRVTLVFGASDTQHNNAVVLREYLEERALSPTGVSDSTVRGK